MLNVKGQVGAFNQEKVLVGAFSVIVKLRIMRTEPSRSPATWSRMTSRSWGRSSSCSGGTPARGGRGSSGGGGQCGKTGNHGNIMVILWYSW